MIILDPVGVPPNAGSDVNLGADPDDIEEMYPHHPIELSTARVTGGTHLADSPNSGSEGLPGGGGLASSNRIAERERDEQGNNLKTAGGISSSGKYLLASTLSLSSVMIVLLLRSKHRTLLSYISSAASCSHRVRVLPYEPKDAADAAMTAPKTQWMVHLGSRIREARGGPRHAPLRNSIRSEACAFEPLVSTGVLAPHQIETSEVELLRSIPIEFAPGLDSVRAESCAAEQMKS